MSGKELVAIFVSFGFTVISQKGSHIKLRRTREHTETLIVPNHDPLDRGTQLAIYKAGVKWIGEEQLKSHFYTE